MNLRDFTYVIAVAQHRHFGKAAEACHVSQPALSMQIHKLEETLGVALFERTKKQVLVTEAGEAIIARLHTILRDVQDIRDIAQSYQDPLAGDMRLGAFPTLAPYLFPRIVPVINQAMPRLRLLLVEDKTEPLLHSLQQAEIEAALIALPIDIPNVEYLPLFNDPFLLAVPPSHHLATRKQAQLSDLTDEDVLLLEEGHCLSNQALSVCTMVDVNPQQDFRATSMETLRPMVASGIGITLIPSLAQKAHDGIVYIPFAAPAPQRTIALVWRATSAYTARMEKLAMLIKEELAKHTAVTVI